MPSALHLGRKHTCAILNDGSARCWGDNSNGALGDGTETDRMIPAPVIGLAAPVAQLTAGEGFTCARLATGAVQCWGWNHWGQLADGTITSRTSPVTVQGLGDSVIDVAAGSLHACALLAAGDAKCWGWNHYGQVGDGTILDYTPQAVVVTCYALNVGHTGAGLDPAIAPTKLASCPGASFLPSAVIPVTAQPASGWVVNNWSGTDNDAHTGLLNTVTMTAADRTVGVTYRAICYRLTLSHSGDGQSPVATPEQTTGCGPGEYWPGGDTGSQTPAGREWLAGPQRNRAGEHGEGAELGRVCYARESGQAACGQQHAGCAPEGTYTTDYHASGTGDRLAVGSWQGTDNDAHTGLVNTVKMPAADHAVAVNYGRVCYPLTLNRIGQGQPLVATPEQSPGCTAGAYWYQAVITVRAEPDTGWVVVGWQGTDNDAQTGLVNTVTMPAANHTAAVIYGAGCYPLTLKQRGQGQPLVATPGQSPGCGQGAYKYEQQFTVTAAPALTWGIAAWDGIGQKALRATVPTTMTVSLRMAAQAMTVSVTYAHYAVQLPAISVIPVAGERRWVQLGADEQVLSAVSIDAGMVHLADREEAAASGGLYRGNVATRCASTVGFARAAEVKAPMLALVMAGSLGLAGADTPTVYRTTDGGVNWTPVALSIPGANPRVYAVAIANSGVAYAGTSGGLQRSGDGGATWSPVAGLAQSVNALRISPDGTLWIRGERWGVALWGWDWMDAATV
ncbi:MAG: hypothetical protein IPK16_28570 [Anaerolineales bacterium]|nr:hypothetical protein [Anaerolineales bacterium]